MSKSTDAVYDFSMSDINLPSWWGKKGREFGCFSEDGREYIITTPDTPRPWLNYLGNNDYGLVFGNHGEGFSWYRSMTSRVTRYTSKEYVPREPDSGRAVYLKFKGEDGIYSIGNDNPNHGYKCVHGLGYSIVSNSFNGVTLQWKVFVPVEGSLEIWQVKLVNDSDCKKEVELTPVLEWQLGMHGYQPPCVYNPLSDMENDLVASFNENLKLIIARNQSAQPMAFSGFFKSLDPITKWDCRRSSLLGDNILSLDSIELGCGNAENEPAIAAFMVNATLEPGETKSLNFIGGVFAEDSDLDSLLTEYANVEAIDKSFDELEKHWDAIIHNNVYVETPDVNVDLWANIRLKHLNQITKRWTRGLDRGYRDILQDLRGYIGINAAEVRKYFLKTLRYQYSDGRAVRQWSQVGTNHDLRDYSDSPVWMADVLTAYIKETGDFDILKEEVEFFDDGKASVYKHLLRGLWYLYDNRGQHGLCLIRYGDWNDALEGISRHGKAQGVWLSMALYWAMDLTQNLASKIQDTETANRLLKAMQELKHNINEHGWSGKWYAYAIDDEGKLIGSDDEPEGKLHLNPQTFAIFTGVATPERAQLVKHAIEQYLMTDIGPLLVWPSYKDYEVGRIWRMEPGTFENGSMYFHGAAFKIIADIEAGDSDSAIDTFLKILPTNNVNPNSRSTIEPYALGNFYCGRESEYFGTNLYSHFTGSYPWLMKALTEKMIGIEADYDGLWIKPRLPKSWDKVSVVKYYRGVKYAIDISTDSGTVNIAVNGKEFVGSNELFIAQPVLDSK